MFGPTGDRLAFRIASVTIEGESIDMTAQTDPQLRVTPRGDRLHFPEFLVGKRRLEITLAGPNHGTFTQRIALMACRQRTPVSWGRLEADGDVRASVLTGRLTGCPLSEAWWIKAVEMFAGQDSTFVHEGHIRVEDGSFAITSSMEGTRHILVVGRGKEPVKSFAVNIIEAGKNDAGLLNLSEACPGW